MIREGSVVRCVKDGTVIIVRSILQAQHEEGLRIIVGDSWNTGDRTTCGTAVLLAEDAEEYAERIGVC